ncbi:MAG: hypothetical protein AABY22_33000 [Nanoarchaeota archaeon]
MIKVKKFESFEEDQVFNDFKRWQEENPKVKIIDTKIVTRQTYVENILLVTYEEKSK